MLQFQCTPVTDSNLLSLQYTIAKHLHEVEHTSAFNFLPIILRESEVSAVCQQNTRTRGIRQKKRYLEKENIPPTTSYTNDINIGGSPDESRCFKKPFKTGKKPRRIRTEFSDEQTAELESVFKVAHYPDVDTRRSLAEKINLPQDIVQIWFQNRRARYRKYQPTAIISENGGISNFPASISPASQNCMKDEPTLHGANIYQQPSTYNWNSQDSIPFSY